MIAITLSVQLGDDQEELAARAVEQLARSACGLGLEGMLATLSVAMYAADDELEELEP